MNKREEKAVLRAAMSILGSRTSARKKRSSRLNGSKRKAKSRQTAKINQNK